LFYKINADKKMPNLLVAASDEEVGQANTLLGMPIFASAALEVIKSAEINDVYCASIGKNYTNNAALKLRASIVEYYTYFRQHSMLPESKNAPLVLSDSFLRALGKMDLEDLKQRKERIAELKEIIKIIRRFPPLADEISEEEKLVIFMKSFKDAEKIYYKEFIEPKLIQAHKERQIDRFMDRGYSREYVRESLEWLEKNLPIFLEKEKASGVNYTAIQIAARRIEFYEIYSFIPKHANDHELHLLIGTELLEMSLKDSLNFNSLPRCQFHDDHAHLDVSAEGDDSKESELVSGAESFESHHSRQSRKKFNG